MWDVSNNVQLQYPKAADTVNIIPSLAKGSKIWDVARMQPWLSLELMAAQGFPTDSKLSFSEEDMEIPQHVKDAILQRVKYKDVSDSDLHRMAGNTMSVPIMVLLQVVL